MAYQNVTWEKIVITKMDMAFQHVKKMDMASEKVTQKFRKMDIVKKMHPDK